MKCNFDSKTPSSDLNKESWFKPRLAFTNIVIPLQPRLQPRTQECGNRKLCNSFPSVELTLLQVNIMNYSNLHLITSLAKTILKLIKISAKFLSYYAAPPALVGSVSIRNRAVYKITLSVLLIKYKVDYGYREKGWERM